MGRVFISYSHKDSLIVEQVNECLNKHHILTWFDINNIKASDHWDKHIKTAIYASDVFLMFYSHNYNQSEYCKKEFEMAKENNINIMVVGLDDSVNSFSIHEDISAIQRVKYDYNKNTVNELSNELLSHPLINRCKIVNNVKFDGTEDSFIHGISEIDNPKHQYFLKLFLSFLLDVKEKNNNDLYISNKANFSSLIFIKNNNDYRIELIGKDDFNSYENNNQEVFLKNVLYSLFNYTFRTYSIDLPQSILFNEIFSGNIIHSYLNEEIEKCYHLLFDIDSSIEKINKVLSSALYYDNILEYQLTNRILNEYQINDLVLKIAKTLYLEKNPYNYKINSLVFPNIKNELDIEYLSTSDVSSLELLINTIGDQDVFLYGEEGLGKSSILIDYFLNHDDSLYIDLNLYGNKFDKDIIRNSIANMDDKCYKIDYNSIFTYSTFEKPIVLLLDNFDYLPRHKRNLILEELSVFDEIFKVIIVSSKRNIEEKISIDNKVSVFKHYLFCEINRLDKEKIINYLTFLGIKDSLRYELINLDASDNVFKFFNSFDKLNVLYYSIKDLNDFSINQLQNDINSEIKVYQMIFESKSDYSVSKRMSGFFKDTIVPIDDVIMELMIDEINKLKEISYHNNLDKIKSLRFKDFDCVYSILSKHEDNYQFQNEDIKSYFVASFIYSKIKESENKFLLINDLLKPFKNDYKVLKYLNAFDIFDYIDLNLLFSLKDEFIDLKYLLFKISQYSKETRILYSTYTDIEEIPDGFFFGAENIVTVTIPKTIKLIGRAAFTNMTKLEKLVLLSDKEELVIRPWAIINCPKLQSIKLGKNYYKFNHPLVSQCPSLKEITVHKDNPCFSTIYDNQMLVDKDIKKVYLSLNSLKGEVVIPEGIVSLESNACAYLDYVTKIVIPSSVLNIETNFSDFSDKLAYFEVDKNNKNYYSDECGYIYQNINGLKTLMRVPSGTKEDIRIKNDVKVIGSDSISCCGHVKNIYVPKSVEYIENYAFADTVSLNYLEFECIENIKKIENYIFLSTNDYLRIGIVDEEDDYIYLNVDKFNKIYNKDTVNEFVVNMKESIVNLDIFKEEGFEIISDCHNIKTYSKIQILRSINIFENLFTYDPNNYNILMIGMTEFNAINMKGSLEMEQYIDNLLNTRHISLIVFTRDLPMINKLYNYTDRVSIIRSSKGSTSCTRKLIELLNK